MQDYRTLKLLDRFEKVFSRLWRRLQDHEKNFTSEVNDGWTACSNHFLTKCEKK